MHQQLVIVLLVGLAASAYGLDLSHAAERSTEEGRAARGFLNDLYAQVVYPPLNHVVTSLALLGAQVLAGLHENGLPSPKGRTSFDPSEAQLRGFFDDMWNQGVKPPIEQALSGLSLMLAQVLAGVGTNGIDLSSIFSSMGKRDLTEAEMRGFTDAFTDALNHVYANVLQKPLESALSSGALMLAQVLAGMGTNGVDLSSIFSSMGKRDLTEAEMRGFTDAFTDALNHVYANVLQKPLESALSSGALMLAQVLAGMGTNGIDLSSIFSSMGKRDLTDTAARQAQLRGIFDSFADNLLNSLQSVWSNVFQGPVQGALQSSALMAAQVLAGLGVNGINLPGKRDLTADARGPIFDGIFGHFTGLYNGQVKPMIETALSNAALHLAGVLANFSQSGRR